jgi:hypothetical protein
MRAAGDHPNDLCVLIDGDDTADKSYEELRKHVESCQECREEIRLLKSVDAVFRSREFEIDAPPFQWERIRARLEESQPAMGWWERVYEAFKPRQLAWKFALGTLLAVVLSLSGLEYHRYIERNQFGALVAYSESERQRMESADNPFRSPSAAQTENPFTRFQIQDDRSNPFAIP